MLSKSHLFNTLDHIGRLGVNRIGQRKRACIDILLIVSLVFVDFWLLKPFGFKLASALLYFALIVLMASTYRRISILPYLSQLPRPTLPRVSIVVTIATIIQVVLILICAHMAGVLEADLTWASFGKPPSRLPSWVVGKVITVIAQQVGLQLILFPLCFVISKKKMGCCFHRIRIIRISPHAKPASYGKYFHCRPGLVLAFFIWWPPYSDSSFTYHPCLFSSVCNPEPYTSVS